MSAFSGPQYRGAQRDNRAAKHMEALARAEDTQPGDRRRARCPGRCGHITHERPSRHGRQA